MLWLTDGAFFPPSSRNVGIDILYNDAIIVGWAWANSTRIETGSAFHTLWIVIYNVFLLTKGGIDLANSVAECSHLTHTRGGLRCWCSDVVFGELWDNCKRSKTGGGNGLGTRLCSHDSLVPKQNMGTRPYGVHVDYIISTWRRESRERG